MGVRGIWVLGSAVKYSCMLYVGVVFLCVDPRKKSRYPASNEWG